jgi:hypothetical protein
MTEIRHWCSSDIPNWIIPGLPSPIATTLNLSFATLLIPLRHNRACAKKHLAAGLTPRTETHHWWIPDIPDWIIPGLPSPIATDTKSTPRNPARSSPSQSCLSQGTLGCRPDITDRNSLLMHFWHPRLNHPKCALAYSRDTLRNLARSSPFKSRLRQQTLGCMLSAIDRYSLLTFSCKLL